jgi:orotidine-5'-phosphate decarboxylase
MNEPNDRLIVALDVDGASRALELHEALHEHVSTFKVGMQLFTAAGPDLVRKMISRGSRIFLDLKFHDIPNTVAMAAQEAVRLGVTMFNVHASGGSEMMQRAAEAVADVAAREGLRKPIVLGVTLLTSADRETLHQIGISDSPEHVVRRLAALAKSSELDGVVASAQELKLIRDEVRDQEFVVVCPGIRTAQDATHDQRRSMSAGDAVRAGANYVVVGRPVLNASDPIKASLAVQEEIRRSLTAAAIN